MSPCGSLAVLASPPASPSSWPLETELQPAVPERCPAKGMTWYPSCSRKAGSGLSQKPLVWLIPRCQKTDTTAESKHASQGSSRTFWREEPSSHNRFCHTYPLGVLAVLPQECISPHKKKGSLLSGLSPPLCPTCHFQSMHKGSTKHRDASLGAAHGRPCWSPRNIT